METTLNNQLRKLQKPAKLTLNERILKTIKVHKKRTSTDAYVGLIISTILFINLM